MFREPCGIRRLCVATGSPYLRFEALEIWGLRVSLEGLTAFGRYPPPDLLLPLAAPTNGR